MPYPADSSFSEQSDDTSYKSQFTYRDLRLLSQSSTISPLRVIVLIDFDCFYAQCESVRLGLPDDQPLGVQQFLHVIAINYPARAAGLKKVVTAVEAKRKCPNIVLQHVPTWREGDTTWAYRADVLQHISSDKSSLDYYRLQSRKAIEIVKTVLPAISRDKIEKASIDEIFVDLSAQVHRTLRERYPELLAREDEALEARLPSPWTRTLDWRDNQLMKTDTADEQSDTTDWDDVALNIGSEIVRDLRAEIYKQLRYTCSAGIARNKVVAKLAAGHNKPNKQTLIRTCDIPTFLSTYKITKLRGLGGKLGDKVVKSFACELVSDMLKIPLKSLQSSLGIETGLWLFRVLRGEEYNEVTPRTQIQSMLSAKTFTPAIDGIEQAERWLQIFAADIVNRLDDQEGRRPKSLTVHHHLNGRFGPTRSKQAHIPLGSKIDIQCLFKLSKEILEKISHEGPSWPCLSLSVSVSDFYDLDGANHSMRSFMTAQNNPPKTSTTSGTSSLDNNHQLVPKSTKRTILDFQEFSAPKSGQHPDTNPEMNGENKKMRNDSHSEVKTDAPIEIAPQSDEEGSYQCPNCTEMIRADNVLEHLDWHVATELQNQT